MKRSLISRLYYPLSQFLKGHQVQAFYRRLKANERISKEELNTLQRRLLTSTLLIAAGTPYYKELFREIGFDIRNLDSFAEIPITRKSIITQNPKAFHNPDYRGALAFGRTSGATGIPLQVQYDTIWDQWALASQYRGRSWWGIYPGARELIVWGRQFDARQSKAIFDLKLALMNRKMISCFALSDEKLNDSAPRLIKFNPDVIYGYSTGVGRLAEYMREKRPGRNALKPKVVIVTSETLLESQRRAVQDAFGCNPIDEYGSSEAGIIAFECPEGNLHISADRMLLEIADPDETGVGKIVLTPFENRAMPLIRYDQGDFGKISGEKCACGVTLPILELARARVSDVIVTPRGKVSASNFFDFIAKTLIPYGLRQFRAIQKSETRFHLQMIRLGGRDEEIEKIVIGRMREFLGEDIEASFEYVDEIAPEPSGKLRYYVREDL